MYTCGRDTAESAWTETRYKMSNQSHQIFILPEGVAARELSTSWSLNPNQMACASFVLSTHCHTVFSRMHSRAVAGGGGIEDGGHAQCNHGGRGLIDTFPLSLSALGAGSGCRLLRIQIFAWLEA